MSLSTDIAEAKQGISPAVNTAPSEAEGEKREAGSGSDAPTVGTREPVRILGVQMPKTVSDAMYNTYDFGQRLRKKTILSLSPKIVNHSSNVIGATQLVGEMMMMKANNTVFYPPIADTAKKAEIAGSALHKGWYYLSTPFVSMYKSIFKNEGRKVAAREMVTQKFWKEEVGQFFDLEKATLRDSVGGKASLINRWQARSTFAGLVGMAVAAFLPDVKDTDQQIEKRMAFRYNHPFLYPFKAIGEALWFPVETVMDIGRRVLGGKPDDEHAIGQHKRQFTGLGLTIAGVFSFLAGFRNVKGKQIGNQAYAGNRAHSIGGMITAIAGSQVLLSVGSDQAWERFGSIQWLRLAFLPKSITNRYKPDALGRMDPGRHFYLAGQGFLQTTNAESFLFGGAQVREDGTIVDNKQVREEIKREKKREAQEKRMGRVVTKVMEDGDSPVPGTQITGALKAERAMPERVEKAAAEQKEAAVTA